MICRFSELFCYMILNGSIWTFFMQWTLRKAAWPMGWRSHWSLPTCLYCKNIFIYLVLNIKSISILKSCHMNKIATMLTLAYLLQSFWIHSRNDFDFCIKVQCYEIHNIIIMACYVDFFSLLAWLDGQINW